MKNAQIKISFIRKLPDLVLALSLAYYFFLQFWTLKLPGGECDEMLPINNAFRIMNLSEGGSLLNNFCAGFSNSECLMMSAYHGALESFLLLPFLRLFGFSVPAMRILPVICGGMTIVLTYLFLKRLFNCYTGILAVILLVSNPTFMLATKYGLGNSGTILSVLYLGALFCFYKWYKFGNRVFLHLGLFICGLGLWSRVWFLWFIFGLLVSVLVFWKDIKRKLLLCGLRRLALGGSFLLLGCAPFLIHEYFSKGSVVRFVVNGLFNTQDKHDNLKYLVNLNAVCQNFNQVVNNRFLSQTLLGFGFDFKWGPDIFVFWLSLLSLAVPVAANGNWRYRKSGIFLVVLFSSMFLATPLSHSGLPNYHFIFFYPIIQMIISCAMFNWFVAFRKLKFLPIVPFFVICLLLSSQARQTFSVYSALIKFGGSGMTSSSVYELCDWLEKRRYQEVVACDFGLQRILQATSGGRINDLDLGYNHLIGQDASGRIREKFVEGVNKNLSDGRYDAYVIYGDDFSSRNKFLSGTSPFDILNAIAAQRGVKLKEVKQFFQKDGRLVYRVFEAGA